MPHALHLQRWHAADTLAGFFCNVHQGSQSAYLTSLSYGDEQTCLDCGGDGGGGGRGGGDDDSDGGGAQNWQLRHSQRGQCDAFRSSVQKGAQPAKFVSAESSDEHASPAASDEQVATRVARTSSSRRPERARTTGALAIPKLGTGTRGL